MKIETVISWGYMPLLDIFGKANTLVWKFEKRVQDEPSREFITILYDEGSDTEMTLTYLALRHLGIENMLCDYLMKCGIDPQMISIGQFVMRKSPEEIEKGWQEHRRKIGLAR